MNWKWAGAPLALYLVLGSLGCAAETNNEAQPQVDMGQEQADAGQTQNNQDTADVGAGEDLTPDEPDADEPDADEPDADEPDADEPDADEPDADEPDADEPEPDMEGGQLEPLGWPTEPGDYTLSMDSGGLTRTMEMHVPPQISQGQALPVILVLHGGNGSGARLQETLGFDAYADQDGAIVIYPDGVESNWADGRGTTDAALAGVDDIGFFTDVLDQVALHDHMDAQRVWFTGASNGGIMTHRVACDLADRVAAVAPVISALPTAYVESCQPARPIPMLAIQGTADLFINLEGGDASHDTTGLGDGGLIESAQATAAFWAQHNGCDPEPTVQALEPTSEDDETTVELRTWRGCQGDALIDYYIVHGMGHTWPPLEGAAPRLSGPSSHQLDATALIWAFVRAHALP
jgi:polyhydroxybutyrate depolymerase